MKNKIGLLGSGVVAQTLGNGFIKHGYEVMLGTRDASKLNEWKTQAGEKGKTGSFEEVAEYGEIIVLAVKGAVAESVVKLAGIKNLEGKTVIDATNPIDDSKPPVNGVLQYFTNLNDSLMERLQKIAPTANFVKSFCCVGSPFMVEPKFPGGTPTMFICGNNEEAKKQVNNILLEFGWEVEDMGKVEAARAIEPLAMLWCIPGMIRNQWGHAFKMMKM